MPERVPIAMSPPCVAWPANRARSSDDLRVLKTRRGLGVTISGQHALPRAAIAVPGDMNGEEYSVA